MTLISFAFTAKLICVFVFAYKKRWFSYDVAQFFTEAIDLATTFKLLFNVFCFIFNTNSFCLLQNAVD